jgi:uncharacterized membrane protein YidH (DUF202 family)
MENGMRNRNGLDRLRNGRNRLRLRMEDRPVAVTVMHYSDMLDNVSIVLGNDIGWLRLVPMPVPIRCRSAASEHQQYEQKYPRTDRSHRLVCVVAYSLGMNLVVTLVLLVVISSLSIFLGLCSELVSYRLVAQRHGRTYYLHDYTLQYYEASDIPDVLCLAVYTPGTVVRVDSRVTYATSYQGLALIRTSLFFFRLGVPLSILFGMLSP